jgi:hypothetical protein
VVAQIQLTPAVETSWESVLGPPHAPAPIGDVVTALASAVDTAPALPWSVQ